MIDLLNYQFFLGLIIGGLFIFAIYPIIFKRKRDLSTLEENLNDIKKTMDDLQDKNSSYQGKITEKLESFTLSGMNFEKIANEMKNTLVAGSSQKQGAWGEMVLSHILNKLQFTEGEEFEKHKNLKSDEDEKLIPDFIVHFPQNRDVIIDSKVNLTAWDEYVNSDDENVKENALTRHKQAIKNHIDTLSKKKYQNLKGINTLDAVIMFCPNEAAISSLGIASRKMMDYAIEKKITLVGPAMLYFTLKTVEHFWKAERQSKNTQKIIELANKISSQSIDIYESAKIAQDSIVKTTKGVDDVMKKIKDGKGSFLSKVDNLNKVGGLSPKKNIPEDIYEEIEIEENDEDNNNKLN
ncbi:DNA recombination protein RmuC [Candidatus Pelagibacter sp.]|nr:DNA recombination protein RmuC [Candidatus Pelagibacter sp.]